MRPIAWSFVRASAPLPADANVETPSFLSTSIEEIAEKDYEIDPATGDLVIPLRLVTGADAIAQKLATLFTFWLGAWFLDTSQGAPFLRDVLVKAPNETLIRSLFRRICLQVRGVRSVPRIDLSIDRTTRELSVTRMDVLLVNSETLVLRGSQPFKV